MVTIEPVPENRSEQRENLQKTSHSGQRSENAQKNSGEEAKPVQAHVDAESWETASEGDNNDEPQSISAHAEETYEDATTEEEQKQRALVQANDAKAEGNKFFASGDYEAALSRYANALEIAPDLPTANEVRSMCYANRAICYYKLNKYEETVKESTKAVEINPTYIKALIRRADGHEKLENFEESIADWKKVIELDGSNEQARRSIIRLEPLAAEKREKLKEEMIGKLKDLGNSVLGRFGMSIDNFKAVKDPTLDHIQSLFSDEDTLTDLFPGILYFFSGIVMNFQGNCWSQNVCLDGLKEFSHHSISPKI